MSFTQPQAQKEIHAGVFHQLMSPCHGTVGVFFFSLFFFFSFSSPMLSTRRQCEKKKGIVEWHESERERAKEVFFYLSMVMGDRRGREKCLMFVDTCLHAC